MNNIVIFGKGGGNGALRYDQPQELTPEQQKQAQDNLGIDLSSALKRVIVETLPAEGEDNTIYMVARTEQEEGNVYDEYMYINSSWEKIGSTDVDLTDYYTKEESDDKFLTEHQELKTVNGESIIGEGNVEIKGFSGDYNDLTNKPTILNHWFGTQEEYDAIEEKDENTIYHIEGGGEDVIDIDEKMTDDGEMALVIADYDFTKYKDAKFNYTATDFDIQCNGIEYFGNIQKYKEYTQPVFRIGDKLYWFDERYVDGEMKYVFVIGSDEFHVETIAVEGEERGYEVSVIGFHVDEDAEISEYTGYPIANGDYDNLKGNLSNIILDIASEYVQSGSLIEPTVKMNFDYENAILTKTQKANFDYGLELINAYTANVTGRVFASYNEMNYFVTFNVNINAMTMNITWNLCEVALEKTAMQSELNRINEILNRI